MLIQLIFIWKPFGRNLAFIMRFTATWQWPIRLLSWRLIIQAEFIAASEPTQGNTTEASVGSLAAIVNSNWIDGQIIFILNKITSKWSWLFD